MSENCGKCKRARWNKSIVWKKRARVDEIAAEEGEVRLGGDYRQIRGEERRAVGRPKGSKHICPTHHYCPKSLVWASASVSSSVS